ncbi:UDP-N-acetylmuramate dehydrogenase [Xylanimonas cellulosilytica DSM 15894]|uniref:UDP-N-acetylenolpyruvoylglucosamine reductase n=1 Tax=Xylanimonas cellulosilytica (strain DSM 15894 / JCM 12276 / CECT 5975 / KCTC 9989 / LMG 20990 / NBRC 107835 / XIL07) TaxID=446471 RepID=D1BWR0_XYLCX|nr:UDP-N-acetylmuramate dehydrogenase [Xylanimonas cellulosilytica]ACZ29642.1 UDP-N-acetylmuramate dehydrogenase [Xylanimonas cellulosilytica DSM 15894]
MNASLEAPPVPTLAELTTLRVGGPADAYVETTTEAELIDTIRAADDAGEPLLVVGGGSNLLVSDEGFGGVVVRDTRTGFELASADACGGATVTAVGGQDWDELVAVAVENGWVGIEALSGIPGTVGAAPVQNIGAYGQEVAGVLSTVRTWDRLRGRVRTFAVGELGLGYRTSLLKQSMRGVPTDDDPQAPWYPTPRYVVLDVTFQMRLGTDSAPVAYTELATRLGVQPGERAPQAELRAAVLELRAGKGMLQDGRFGSAPGADHDRWSAGSFFTNPIVAADQAHLLPEGAPRYPVRSAVPMTTTGPSLGAIDPSLVKTSAAWLIDHAGFGKGFGVAGPTSRATLSTKHTLALTNRGAATADDLVALARVIRDGVLDAYGVALEPEPVLVGVSL